MKINLLSKSTEEKTAVELYFTELYELVKGLELELKKIQAIAEDALLKARMSNSLIVVRKVEEDKIEELKKILD